MEEPFQLFCCYARSDQQYLAELKKHLMPLQREKLIDIKADIDIDPGMEWERKIHHYLEQAQIILLLISPDFIASNYCYNVEMHKALIQHRQGTACVIPIIIRPVDWRGTPLGTLQALPQDAKPVSSWSNSDEAYTSIARGIRTIVQKSAFFPRDTINRRINISIPLPGKVQDWRLTPRETNYRAQTIAANRFLWVDGFLEKALQSGIFLQLQLQSIPSLVSHEREQLVQELQSVLPSTPTAFTGLLEVYDQTAGAVLLLGEPGSGKTILLLGLLRDLLTRAEHDSAVPLPVLLPLTTWEQQHLKEQQSLEKWMIAELYRWYNLPARLSERWIKAGLLVPLLDGLDEMSENARADCIMAINDYCRSYGLTSPLVISCRTHVYKQLSFTHQLLVREAVLIQPLTEQQVQEYLSAFPDLESTSLFLEQDEHLRDLKTTPLMLSILTQMTHNASPPKQNPLSAGPDISLDDQQFSLFETYVNSMLSRRRAHPSYPTSQIVNWLSWMAWQLAQHNEAAFHHTIIGPDWLPPELHKRYIKIMTSLVAPIVTPIVTAGSFLLFLVNTPQFPTQAQTIQMVTHLIGAWGPSIVRGLLSIGGGIFLILFIFIFILPQRQPQNPLNSSQKGGGATRLQQPDQQKKSKRPSLSQKSGTVVAYLILILALLSFCAMFNGNGDYNMVLQDNCTKAGGTVEVDMSGTTLQTSYRCNLPSGKEQQDVNILQGALNALANGSNNTFIVGGEVVVCVIALALLFGVFISPLLLRGKINVWKQKGNQFSWWHKLFLFFLCGSSGFLFVVFSREISQAIVEIILVILSWLTAWNGLFFHLALSIIESILCLFMIALPLSEWLLDPLLRLAGNRIACSLLRSAKLLPPQECLTFAWDRLLLYKVGERYMFKHPLLRNYFIYLYKQGEK